MQSPNTRDPRKAETTPWWRVGMVWLVLGGPAVVVVAGITTAVIAYRGADPVIKVPQAVSQAERAASIREQPADR